MQRTRKTTSLQRRGALVSCTSPCFPVWLTLWLPRKMVKDNSQDAGNAAMLLVDKEDELDHAVQFLHDNGKSYNTVHIQNHSSTVC